MVAFSRSAFFISGQRSSDHFLMASYHTCLPSADVSNTYLDAPPGGSLNRELSRATFVIPALNEANNLCGLRETLGKQIVPPGIELEVVISDNGSHQETLNQERALEIGGKHVEVVTGSIKGRIYSIKNH